MEDLTQEFRCSFSRDCVECKVDLVRHAPDALGELFRTLSVIQKYIAPLRVQNGFDHIAIRTRDGNDGMDVGKRGQFDSESANRGRRAVNDKWLLSISRRRIPRCWKGPVFEEAKRCGDVGQSKRRGF